MLLFLNLLKVITYSFEITNFMLIWIGMQGVSPGKQKPRKYVKYCCTLYLECLPKSMCSRIGSQSSAIVSDRMLDGGPSMKLLGLWEHAYRGLWYSGPSTLSVLSGLWHKQFYSTPCSVMMHCLPRAPKQ